MLRYVTANNEFNTSSLGTTPVVTFDGLGNDIRACPSGFTSSSVPPGTIPPFDDCRFAFEGGFLVWSVAPFNADGFVTAADGSGETICGPSHAPNIQPGCRVSQSPHVPGNWSLIANNDGDGIEGTIDGTFTGSFNDQSTVASNDFTDQHLPDGTTFGTIVDRSDLFVEIEDDLTEGVVLSVSGGTGTAQIQMCNNPVAGVSLMAGARLNATCGSLRAVMLAGESVIEIGGVIITIPEGAVCEIVVESGSELTVTNVGDVGGIEIDDGVSQPIILEPSEEVMAMLPPDADSDGVPDSDDICPGTVIPEPAPSELGNNRWRLLTGVWVFTQAPPQIGSKVSFTTADTRGCSCEQIVDMAGLGMGHIKKGCSTGVMLNWADNP